MDKVVGGARESGAVANPGRVQSDISALTAIVLASFFGTQAPSSPWHYDLIPTIAPSCTAN